MMYATGNKKMLNMLILEILKEYTDENHRLTQMEMIQLLEKNYGMTCDRRSVRANIDSLKELGYEIAADKGYYLLERDFDDAELRLLIDSVLSAKGVSQSQAKRLIKKLVKQGNRYFQAKVKHIANLPEMRHSDNTVVMKNVEVLNDAIEKKRQVKFIYNRYNTSFKLVPKRDEPYVVNPYQMVVCNGWYYLIGNTEPYDNVSHYRIDKMKKVTIVDKPAKDKSLVDEFVHGYNLPRHMAEHIYMFGGNTIEVQFQTGKYLMDQLVDWFGKDFSVKPLNNEDMLVTVKCNEYAIKYWALQYIEHIEVLKPVDFRQQISHILKDRWQVHK
ncbi:Predicted DNA-binding transcriptional regulator YafY, contains an HTH and WYL domains [Selenomonas ruminantium]|uniref:Predicted DNA-binding transcriptional regulator YafY, contains an HTH and WYL domains n=2 Tax=Selenomonas ruminantium TaxID=971 RepID=A0A1I3C4U5_SELRU|nr:WYL domain-containing protein [Selenomonas ruminantium]SFH69605.1 Predicted DNA-binding transcriptional regulator YafY, contains an HTH and WYL domains [Selenomonas ruminantium]